MVDYLTREDVDAFGSDLINFSMRAAAQAVAPTLAQIQQDSEQLRGQLAREQRHRLDAAVAAAVPDYRTIDNDPNWHHFLLTVDPLSGRVRQALLDEAIRNGDAARVVHFFRSYLAQPPAAVDQPGRSSRPRAGASSDKPVYTRARIAELYAAHRHGAWKGREAEWQKIEADIFQAQREGRVAAYPYITK